MKKTFGLLASAFLLAAAMVATPVSAGPPEEIPIDDYIALFPDVNVNRSVFINITAESFCQWLADGAEGPPPAIDTVQGRLNVTGSGDAVGSIDADLYIELWEFDEDPSPLIGPCEDIQAQLDAGTGPWATGTARWKAKTNNLFESDNRANTFGDRTTAVVTDQAGDTWDYRNVFRLNFSCNAPDDGPPSCLVDNSSLTRR
jgi:hypothetical protein